jgi:RNA polymerase sigma factor (sigma-70 family)
MSSDERLAARAAKGDQRAFEQIYERYHQDLYRFCLAMVGNPQDAQDALQNTMVKVLRGLPGERRTITLKPWLYRIARNEAVEILRRRRDSVELEPQQIPVAAVTETAESRDRLRTLLGDLEQLPERQRAALVLRELSGLDFEQIGASFGTSAAVARQTLYEARLSLRQLEAGREMRCDEVMRELSDADGRVTRRREIRAHLRNCPDCRAFRDEIGRRHEDLAALAPLPIAASAGLLHSVLGAKAGAAAGAAASSAIVKSAATVVVVAVVGVSAADRGGVIDLPLPGENGSASRSAPAQQSGGGAVSDGGVTPAAVSGPSKAGHGSAPQVGEAKSAGGKDGDGGAAENAVTTAPPVSHTRSASEAGEEPPGKGYGRSASRRHGKPDSPPAAAANGQRKNATHEAERAASPPGRGSSSTHAPPSHGPPASNPSHPTKATGPPEREPPPERAPSKAENGAAHSEKPANSPGHGG